MSKGEILYVKGMNISESEGEDGEEDVWDDRKLNDAYDKALKIANAEVAKRVAMSTNSQTNNEDNSKSKKGKTKQTISKNTMRKESATKWKSGMPCRAVYEGDGLEYEAFVLRVINEKECVVRFIGYDNSEIVSINTLKPSFGESERARQIEEALNDKDDDGFGSQSPNGNDLEMGSDRVASPSTERSSQRKAKSKNKKKKQQKSVPIYDLPEMPLPMPNLPPFPQLGSLEMPLPPPPPVSLPKQAVDTEDQAISSMLLSWYMSGYYTGLYQGMKRARDGHNSQIG